MAMTNSFLATENLLSHDKIFPRDKTFCHDKIFSRDKTFFMRKFFLVTIFLPFRDHSMYVNMADNNNNEMSK